MVRYLAVLILLLLFFALLRSSRVWTINQAMRKGLYPPQGKATMFDVRRLILQGKRELAIDVYCDIFKATRREAQKAVDELDKSIQQKKKSDLG